MAHHAATAATPTGTTSARRTPPTSSSSRPRSCGSGRWSSSCSRRSAAHRSTRQGRARLAEVHERSIAELKDGLAPELVEELERIALPFSDEAPTDAELRIAQAQLVGWLEGLFHGIQTALVAQQMAAQAQLQQMRALPPGHHPGTTSGAGPGTGMTMPPGQGGAEPGHTEGTGQYL